MATLSKELWAERLAVAIIFGLRDVVVMHGAPPQEADLVEKVRDVLLAA